MNGPKSAPRIGTSSTPFGVKGWSPGFFLGGGNVCVLVLKGSCACPFSTSTRGPWHRRRFKCGMIEALG